MSDVHLVCLLVALGVVGLTTGTFCPRYNRGVRRPLVETAEGFFLWKRNTYNTTLRLDSWKPASATEKKTYRCMRMKFDYESEATIKDQTPFKMSYIDGNTNASMMVTGEAQITFNRARGIYLTLRDVTSMRNKPWLWNSGTRGIGRSLRLTVGDIGDDDLSITTCRYADDQDLTRARAARTSIYYFTSLRDSGPIVQRCFGTKSAADYIETSESEVVDGSGCDAMYAAVGGDPLDS